MVASMLEDPDWEDAIMLAEPVVASGCDFTLALAMVASGCDCTLALAMVASGCEYTLALAKKMLLTKKYSPSVGGNNLLLQRQKVKIVWLRVCWQSLMGDASVLAELGFGMPSRS